MEATAVSNTRYLRQLRQSDEIMSEVSGMVRLKTELDLLSSEDTLGLSRRVVEGDSVQQWLSG